MTTTPESLAIWAATSDGNMPLAPEDRASVPENGGLDLPTAELMALGGDARITLDEQSGLNAYGCAPKPMPAITYASSTASTVSAGAFAQARAFHYQLRQAAQHRPVDEVYTEAMEEARRRLRLLYGLEADIDIAFGPSGTDLEYLAVASAGRDKRIVRNIIVEVDEVGSGCLNAQKARYFAPRTALGLSVATGELVPGFIAEQVITEMVAVRNADGSLRDEAEREQALADAIGKAIDAGERPLLHVVHRSKTGLIAPKPDVLKRLASRFGDDLDVIVDACQGRISPAMLRGYLAADAIVFITGSKFLGGPPFSAFAFVPKQIGERMRGGPPAPRGLGAFFARGEMPASWGAMDTVLPRVPNFGLLLRLECGLFELSRLLAYPEEVPQKVIAAFGSAVRRLPADSPLRLLATNFDADEAGLPALDRRMLHTFELSARHPESGRQLDIDDARSVYTMLYTDMSPKFASSWQRMIAAETCHLGQPVRCLKLADGRWGATLRLSLSAPHISEVGGLDEDALRHRFDADLDWIGAKIRLILPLLPAEKPGS